MEDNKRDYWIDSLRVYAIFTVILLHVAAPAVVLEYNPASQQNYAWWTANFYNSLSRFCVPVFVMITGALLLPQQIKIKEFYMKRLRRILLPFIFWSLIYLIFSLGLKARDEGLSVLETSGPWIFEKLITGTAVHLWYVYMLLGLYLFIPILSPWILGATDRAIQLFLLIWLFSLFLSGFDFIGAETSLDIRYFSGYVGYLVLGFYLSQRLKIYTSLKWSSLCVFLVGFSCTFFGTYLTSIASGSFSDLFYRFLSVNVFMMSAAIFVFVRTVSSNKPGNFYKLKEFMNKYGFGIYLSHLLILSLLSFFKIDYTITHSIISIPLITVCCLIVSGIVTYLLHQIPYGKYIAG